MLIKMLSFLVLIFSLCGADSICPPEHNLLILEPPEIIAEYGGSPVIVNCTTALNEHDGMYWTVGNEIFQMEDEELFVSHSVPLSDWNVKPKCKIKLHESLECSKDLEVIVFKSPEVVHSIQNVNVMEEETQYWLQCDIINVAPVQFLTVSWYKNNESIMTMSFNDTTTKTPVNESSNLRVNISREENVAEFRCEAELDFGPQGPKLYVNSQTHRGSAHYAPEKNTKNSTQDIFLLEGTTITLSCEAVRNPPPVYNWTCDGENMLENTNSLSITRITGNTTCTCTATNYLGNITHTINVHVEPRGCPLTLTASEIVVKFGDPISINCSTSATDVEGMGWEAPFGGTGFEPPPVVTWRVEKLEEWTPSPFCYATLVDGSQCTVSPVITVYKTPDFVSVPDMARGPVLEGIGYNLKCDIYNVAPVQNLIVKWYRGNETVLTQTFNGSALTPVNTSSTLRISTQRDYNGLIFRCEAELHLGPKGPKFPPNVTSPPYTAVVLYKPLMKACPDHVTVVENAAFSIDMLPCQPDGNPSPTVQWFYEEKLINASKPLTRTDSGKYTAVVENSLDRSNTSVHITVEHAPEFKEGNESKEVLQGEDVTLSCSADSNPPSNIKWIYTAAVNSKETTEGHQKTISITKATSTNGGYYICVTENKAGRNTRFVRLVIKGKTIKIPLPIIWVLLALLIIGLIVLVDTTILFLTKWHRHLFEFSTIQWQCLGYSLHNLNMCNLIICSSM